MEPQVKDGRGGVLLMHHGLAAGCVVSSMCCNLYYGDLENNQSVVRDLLQGWFKRISSADG